MMEWSHFWRCRYIYGYPWHLPDGTISRWISWPAEGFLEPRALTGPVMSEKVFAPIWLVWGWLTTKCCHSLGGRHVHGHCFARCLVENIRPASTSSLRCRAGWSCQLECPRPEDPFHFIIAGVSCDPSPVRWWDDQKSLKGDHLQGFLFILVSQFSTCSIYVSPGRCWVWQNTCCTWFFTWYIYCRCWGWLNTCTEGRARMVCCITGSKLSPIVILNFHHNGLFKFGAVFCCQNWSCHPCCQRVRQSYQIFCHNVLQGSTTGLVTSPAVSGQEAMGE